MKRLASLGLAAVAAGVTVSCGALGPSGPELDPNAVFEIQPISAVIASTKDNGDAWDPDNSPPDISMRMWCTDGSSVTAEEMETFEPRWTSGSCTSTVGRFQDSGVAIEIQDLDPAGNDQVLPRIGIRPSNAEFLAGEMIISPTTQVPRLVLRLVRR
ncbi:MAG: hypothetical protein AB2A00_08825 [Myxococcota bacterium]